MVGSVTKRCLIAASAAASESKGLFRASGTLWTGCPDAKRPISACEAVRQVDSEEELLSLVKGSADLPRSGVCKSASARSSGWFVTITKKDARNRMSVDYNVIWARSS